MLNRLLIGAAGLVAGTLVATPAVLGLSGNSSFSRDIPIPVPSDAHQVHFVGSSDGAQPAFEPEPIESTEDRPGHDVVSGDATDDHGGLRDSTGSGRDGLDDGPRHDAGDDHGGRHDGGDDRRGGSGGSDDSGGGGDG